jgi:hypothetical protein
MHQPKTLFYQTQSNDSFGVDSKLGSQKEFLTRKMIIKKDKFWILILFNIYNYGVLLCIFIRISISKHRSCVGNNYAKKHVQLSINNYLGVLYNFICKPKYWCTTMYAYKRNHCHCMNYLNLNHSCFFHLNLFHINNIVETSEKKSLCRYFSFLEPNHEQTY